MTSHTGHNHPATTAARTACRKETRALRIKAAAFLRTAEGRGTFAYEWAMGKIPGAAVRLGALTDDEAFGTWGYLNGEWVKVIPCQLSTIDILVAIYRKTPTFSWDMFCRMYS